MPKYVIPSTIVCSLTFICGFIGIVMRNWIFYFLATYALTILFQMILYKYDE